MEGKGVTCPLHLCHTCIAGNLKSSAKANHGKFANIRKLTMHLWVKTGKKKKRKKVRISNMFTQKNKQGAVTRSDLRPPGMRTVAGTILTSGKFFCGVWS